MRHLLSMSGFGYAIDLRERAPWLAWLSIGPIHLGRVLLGLPLIVVAGSGLLWLVRRRWLRLGALVAATAGLCAAIVGYYLSVDAGHRSPLEHYVWDDAWRVSLHSVYLVGLLMIAMGLTLALRRGWFRFRRSPKAA